MVVVPVCINSVLLSCPAAAHLSNPRVVKFVYFRCLLSIEVFFYFLAAGVFEDDASFTESMMTKFLKGVIELSLARLPLRKCLIVT